MATKARHKKTAMQLWVVDNRKRLDLESIDLARAADVSEDTARGWESRGRPSEDAITELERLFGVPAPRDDGAPSDQAATAAAIDRQTDVLRLLVEETRISRVAQETTAQAIAEMVGRLDRFLDLANTPAGRALASGAGSR